MPRSYVKVLFCSLLPLALTAFASGCADGDTGPGGSGGGGNGGAGGQGGGEPDPLAAYEDMLQMACDRQVACGYAVLNQGKTVEECLSLQRTATGEVPASLGDGAVILREDRLRACAAAMSAASCQELAAKGVEVDAACVTYWEGTLGEGEACQGGVASDCEAGLVCQFEGQTCPGTCVTPEPPCVEGSCQEGDYCNSAARCVPRVQVGQACGATVEGALHESACAAGGYCADEVCVAQVAAGAACTGSFERECEEGYTCLCTDEGCSAKACAPQVELGEPCAQASQCADGRFCNFTTNECDDRKDEGEACPESYGACKPGLVCAGGECLKPADVPAPEKPLVEAGGDCTKQGICPLGETCLCELEDCSTGKKLCQAGPALGESCEEAATQDFTPFVCKEGICDVLETFQCVTQAPAGSPCTGVFTFACGSGVCNNGKCASLEETRCTP